MPTIDSTDKDTHDYLTAYNTGYTGGTGLGNLGRSHRPQPQPLPTPPKVTASDPVPVPRLPVFVPHQPQTTWDHFVDGTYLDAAADAIEEWIDERCSRRGYHIFALLIAVTCAAIGYYFGQAAPIAIGVGAGVAGWLLAYIAPKSVALFAQLVAGTVRTVHGLAQLTLILGSSALVLWLAGWALLAIING